MSRPQKNARTGVYYFRQRVPADLRSTVGKAEVSRSLDTKNAEEAKARALLEASKQAAIWTALRAKPEPIPLKKLVALAGIFYGELLNIANDEPGEPSLWRTMLAKFDVENPDIEKLEGFYGADADRLLQEAGMSADEPSRLRLCAELHKTWLQWSNYQLNRSSGDFSPDPAANRFSSLELPVGAPAAAPTAKKSGPTLTDLFESWQRDHIANGGPKKTAIDFRQKITRLGAFLGHEDASLVTPENIADWCEHLREVDGLAPKTVAHKYLAAVKTVFALAIEKRKLKTNPAKESKVRVPKKRLERSKGFTDDEAKTILAAALHDPETLGRRADLNKLAIRWVPWICAYTGARVGEITQLRRDDVVEEFGVLCLRITPEAGSTKSGNYRVVPVHPHLLEMGLREFVRANQQGPLFFSADESEGAFTSKAKNAAAKVGQWVRDVAGITDKRVWPNHGWRHRLKTIARDVGIDPAYADAIQGHEDGRASSGYGEMTVKALWREIQKLPRYDVSVAATKDI